MSSTTIPIRLAPPPSRANDERTARDVQLVNRANWITTALEQLPVVAAIVNRDRTIVYVNRVFAETLHIADRHDVIGCRLGVAVNCVHSREPPGGCGTTPFCAVCGAAQAQIAALDGRDATEECRIRTAALGEDLTLQIWARPIAVHGEPFALLAMIDVSGQRRRDALERIFFHDVLNTAGGIRGLAQLIAEGTAPPELMSSLARLSDVLIEEIQAQQDLLAIERGEYTANPDAVDSDDLLAEVASVYACHDVAHGRTIVVSPTAARVRFVSDRRLLRRVLGNMTKNALEACPPGATVTLDCATPDDRVAFSVHNPTAMPHDIQLQMFQRSFSTKGRGRGLGTYSMKLISERYLGGRVSFRSTPEEGTTFVADYPLALPETTTRPPTASL